MKKIIFLSSCLFLGLFMYLIYASSLPPLIYIAEKVDWFQQPQEVITTPLLFTGDIMLGRYVERLKNEKGLNPFGSTTPFLKSHITVANLEGPIPLAHKPTPSNGFAFSFPEDTGKFLKDHGISAVSLSNNHMLDQGVKGYEDTKKILDEEGIFHFGGYDSKSLDYFETQLGTTTIIIFGINMISSMWNEQATHDLVRFLRAKYPEAYLLSYIHWGNEYTLQQGVVQQNFAHKLIDEGMNIIIGSHPHVVEGIEIYKNSPIFYSLGNFIFDQYFSQETQEGYMVSIDKQKNNFIFNLIPVISKKSQINIADEVSSKRIRDTIKKSSSPDLSKSIEDGQISIPIQ